MNAVAAQPRRRAKDSTPRGIILFDGQCALCSRSIRFIYQHDRHRFFRYASLQSATGQQLLLRYGIARTMDTMVLIEPGGAYMQSTAVLRIARHLRWPWKLLGGLLVIPAFLRDPLYATLARHRYQWFGKTEQCSLPPAGLRDAML